MFVYWIHLPEHIDMTIDGYIGVAKNFEQRMFAHKSCAKTGKEQTLYKAIRKHGWDCLVKQVVAIASDDYCLELEKKLRPKERIGWNIAVGGGEITGTHLKGKKQSHEHIANRKKALVGRVSGMRGVKHTDAAKEKCRQANLGKILSDETKKKVSVSNSKPLIVNGIVYASWKEASEKTGIPTGSISYLLKNKPAKSKWSEYDLREAI
jgi:group I intron endonuclease